MKKLINTEKLLQEKLSSELLSSYAILVGYGDDEWEFTSPNVDLDSYFDAASIGKVFPTSTLALKAIGEGRLSLDDTLENFFPNVSSDKKNITVKQLMTHTSGMTRREFPDNVAERGRESIAEFIFGVPLQSEPGTCYAYCCTGMILLGFIVEKVYGMGLDEAFAKYLCKPLGLTRSKYNIRPDEPNAVNCNHDISITDIRWDDNNVKRMNGIPAGPGGLFITAGDLRKFTKAIINRDERLYTKEMFELAEQNYTGNLPVHEPVRGIENHGLGFTYVNENCPQACELFPKGSIGHDGWSGQSFYLNRDKRLYVILLTDATRCCYKIKHRLDYMKDICGMRAEFHRAIKLDLEL